MTVKKEEGKLTNYRKVTPESFLEFMKENAHQFCRELNNNRDILIKKTTKGLKRGTITY